MSGVSRERIYINKEREGSGKEPLAKSTFYRATKQPHIPQYSWFARKLIKLPSTYSVVEARDSLSTIFTYSDLKAYGGADIETIYNRWIKAKDWFSVYGVDPMVFYPEILSRERHLRSLLTSYHPTGRRIFKQDLYLKPRQHFWWSASTFFWMKSFIEEVEFSNL